MGIMPEGETRASMGTSLGVIGITSSSKICTEYERATAQEDEGK